MHLCRCCVNVNHLYNDRLRNKPRPHSKLWEFTVSPDELTSLCLLQVKVMTELDLLAVACEQFLGKSVMEIKAVVLQTLEGHLRSILGTDMNFILTAFKIRTPSSVV